jgi:hypothetical protein
LHLVNRGTTDVYLGLRFADRSAFDYALRGPAGATGASAGAGALVTIESPGCL